MAIDSNFIIFAVLAMLVVGAIFYAIFYNSIASQKKSAERRKNLSSTKAQKVQKQAKVVDEKQRRKMREESLKNLDSQKQRNDSAVKPNLARKLQQAGLEMKPKKFYTICVIVGLVTLLLPTLLGAPIYIGAGMAVIFGWGLPNWTVSFIRARRIKKFLLGFPGAVDIIVRGIKSGLPLNDCMRIIAKDTQDPIREEFAALMESTQVGLSVPEACKRMYENVPCAETNFFAIVISIQSAAGGNLSEALGNLSQVLRERKAMADKIKAMAMEAKMSGYIIGALPFVVAFLVHLTSPGYMNPLWETGTGHKIMLAIVILMTLGIGSMWKMMNFKF